MQFCRTPDERFLDLPGYPFEPHYATVDAGDGSGTRLRVHYLDEGPSDGAVVLALHGEPSWSYLYREMIAPLTAAGLRVVAPDLVGFGRSDKPARVEDYTYARHVEWLRQLVFDTLDLREVTLLCQDWGGLLGLRLVAEHPDRFARVVAANTGLPDGAHRMPPEWWRFRDFVAAREELPIGLLISRGCATDLPPAVVAAYEAPFPDSTYQAGARAFPDLIPQTPDDVETPRQQAAWAALETFTKPVLTAFSDGDPITRGAEALLQRRIPGAAGQPHVTIRGGGHFLQEDRGGELAGVVAGFVAATR